MDYEQVKQDIIKYLIANFYQLSWENLYASDVQKYKVRINNLYFSIYISKHSNIFINLTISDLENRCSVSASNYEFKQLNDFLPLFEDLEKQHIKKSFETKLQEILILKD